MKIEQDVYDKLMDALTKDVKVEIVMGEMDNIQKERPCILINDKIIKIVPLFQPSE